MKMTEGEKMVWAAAFVHAMTRPDIEDEVGAARMATHIVVETLRSAATKLAESEHKDTYAMIQEIVYIEPPATRYDCAKCKIAVILPPEVDANVYIGLCPTCYEENR